MSQVGPVERSSALSRAFWLSMRGSQQMDLASRFSAEADRAGLRVLALKGISIAEQLYGSLDRRPMADVDFLIVDTQRFVEAANIARVLGLVEVGASDHALVFKETASGVVLELHISLTSCVGLFEIDHEALWDRRTLVQGAAFSRLGHADLVVHLALHTAFQHGFSANDFHYGDFERALTTLRPSLDDVVRCAAQHEASAALSAMARACARRFPDSESAAELARRIAHGCPPRLARWMDQWTEPSPPVRVADLAFVRYQLAPSKARFLRHSLLPAVIPGRTLPRSSVFQRLSRLFDLGVAPVPKAPGRVS